jgi:hypothetical protein
VTPKEALKELKALGDEKVRKQAIAIGEKLGIYRDWPVSKGCTSPLPRFGSTTW